MSSLKNQSFLRGVVDQLFESNLTFCVVCVHSHLTFQRQLRRQIKKNTLYIYLRHNYIPNDK
jgi:hypothetical protein